MKLFTSYFGRSSKNERAVSIARGMPKFFLGPQYISLCPPWHLVRGGHTEEEFTKFYYKDVLSKLSPAKVVSDLGDGAVMLCWEPVGKFCHRSIVAKWIIEKTGVEVEEIVIIKPKAEIIDFAGPAIPSKDVEQLSLFQPSEFRTKSLEAF